jgi:arylsulfatase A-like enzyme
LLAKRKVYLYHYSIVKRPVNYLIIFILIVAALFIRCAPAESSQDRPNVLFIIVDTLRADHLGCYGDKNIKTPNIDGIARQGTMFRNAFTQVPLTFPSHTTIFTSTYPQYSNMYDNGSNRLDSKAVTLAQLLQDNGYSTAAFVSTVVLDSKYGLNKGFQTYDSNIGNSLAIG